MTNAELRATWYLAFGADTENAVIRHARNVLHTHYSGAGGAYLDDFVRHTRGEVVRGL